MIVFIGLLIVNLAIRERHTLSRLRRHGMRAQDTVIDAVQASGLMFLGC
jgi:hypothetical protein